MKFVGRHSALGLGVAAVTLAADQAHKWWMIDWVRLGERGKIEVTSFLDIVLHWNRGISYGLFKQETVTGAWILAVFALVTAFAIGVWLANLPTRLTALSAGLIMGGALGNAIDRIRFGAVADYFSFHIGSFHWYIFNIADIAIVAGVAGLLYDWVKSGHKAVENKF